MFLSRLFKGLTVLSPLLEPRKVRASIGIYTVNLKEKGTDMVHIHTNIKGDVFELHAALVWAAEKEPKFLEAIKEAAEKIKEKEKSGPRSKPLKAADRGGKG